MSEEVRKKFAICPLTGAKVCLASGETMCPICKIDHIMQEDDKKHSAFMAKMKNMWRTRW